LAGAGKLTALTALLVSAQELQVVSHDMMIVRSINHVRTAREQTLEYGFAGDAVIQDFKLSTGAREAGKPKDFILGGLQRAALYEDELFIRDSGDDSHTLGYVIRAYEEREIYQVFVRGARALTALRTGDKENVLQHVVPFGALVQHHVGPQNQLMIQIDQAGKVFGLELKGVPQIYVTVSGEKIQKGEIVVHPDIREALGLPALVTTLEARRPSTTHVEAQPRSLSKGKRRRRRRPSTVDNTVGAALAAAKPKVKVVMPVTWELWVSNEEMSSVDFAAAAEATEDQLAAAKARCGITSAGVLTVEEMTALAPHLGCKLALYPDVEEPVAEVIEEPIAEVIEEPVAEVIEEPIAEVIEEPIAEVIEEPVAEVIEEPVAEVIEEPVAEVIEEPIAEVIEEPIAEVIEEPIAEVIEEPIAEDAAAIQARFIAEVLADQAAGVVTSPVRFAEIAAQIAALPVEAAVCVAAFAAEMEAEAEVEAEVAAMFVAPAPVAEVISVDNSPTSPPVAPKIVYVERAEMAPPTVTPELVEEFWQMANGLLLNKPLLINGHPKIPAGAMTKLRCHALLMRCGKDSVQAQCEEGTLLVSTAFELLAGAQTVASPRRYEAPVV
jgi:hypothetical protein